jgi:predicted HTH transcriptional regulator
MPTNEYMRERLIRLIQQNGPTTVRKLLRKFNGAARASASAQIGQLLSDGVFVTTGIGHKGYPKTIQAGPTFPAKRCPFCLRDMPY